MTDPNLPDVTNADIRAMVLRNHEPDETWNVAGRLLSVHCGTCYQPWPCPSRQAAWEAEQEAGRAALRRVDAQIEQARQSTPRRRRWRS